MLWQSLACIMHTQVVQHRMLTVLNPRCILGTRGFCNVQQTGDMLPQERLLLLKLTHTWQRWCMRCAGYLEGVVVKDGLLQDAILK